MSNTSKIMQGRTKRALQYLQAALAHVDMTRLRQVGEVTCMASGDVYPVEEMANCASIVGYPVGAFREGSTLWIGLDVATADYQRDKYVFFAWGKDDVTGELLPDWPMTLSSGIESQLKFSAALRKALAS